MKNSRPSWLFVFKILWIGKSKIIGKWAGCKSFMLNAAILGPIAIGFVQGNQILLLSGSVPPQVPVIRGTGKFVQMNQGQASWIAFVTNDGRTYNMQRGTSIQGSSDMPQELPPPTVYAEGFLRQNGEGYFWPTLIQEASGRVLITPERSISMLMEERRRNIVLLLCEASIFFLLGVVSFLNINFLRNKIFLEGEK